MAGVPDQLISEPTPLTAGGTELVLYPAPGGETSDALMVHLPASGVLFAGDVLMPYLGQPFAGEGSPEGLLETLAFIGSLRPRLLIHGHTTLTEQFTAEAVARPGAGRSSPRPPPPPSPARAIRPSPGRSSGGACCAPPPASPWPGCAAPRCTASWSSTSSSTRSSSSSTPSSPAPKSARPGSRPPHAGARPSGPNKGDHDAQRFFPEFR